MPTRAIVLPCNKKFIEWFAYEDIVIPRINEDDRQRFSLYYSYWSRYYSMPEIRGSDAN